MIFFFFSIFNMQNLQNISSIVLYKELLLYINDKIVKGRIC